MKFRSTDLGESIWFHKNVTIAASTINVGEQATDVLMKDNTAAAILSTHELDDLIGNVEKPFSSTFSLRGGPPPKSPALVHPRSLMLRV